MPPLDSWLKVTIRIPFLLFPVLVFFLIGLVASAVFVYRRLQLQFSKLSRETDPSREVYSHFLYYVSHEVLANPLQTIQSSLESMAGCSPGETGRWQQHYAIIKDQIQQMAALTENLRLLSHLETLDAPTVREPVNLKAVIEDVIMALSETAEAHKVRLRYVGPDRPARVLGDRGHLNQALINLVDNGIKYSRQPEGGDVIISVQEEQHRLCVRVSDEGVGISEDDLPHIFDIYRAREARSFRRKGSGLGLSLVKRVIEQHGGQIRVQSRLGEGATFSFDLPLYIPAKAPAIKQ
jgi:signal transduction histidine kinase